MATTKKHLLILTIAAVIFSSFISRADETQLPDKDETLLLDKIAAVVNDDIILMSSLNAAMREIKTQLLQNGTTPPPDSILQKQVLDNLIIEELQIQEAKERGITVDDETVDASMRELARNNNMSLEAFRNTLLKDGIDYIEYRKILRRQIMMQQLRQGAVSAQVMISRQEVEDFIENQTNPTNAQSQYLLSHIFVSLPETASPEAIKKSEEKANSIYERLNKGEDFAKIAIGESDGQDALQGGNLGWKQLNQLPTLFAKALIKLRKDEVSQPLRSASGFHILKLLDIKGEERHVVEQIKARHILVKLNELLNDEQARAKLAGIRDRIIQGEEFGPLAKVHSEDPVSAAQGGELGWAAPDSYVPQFSKVITSLPKGKLSEPFKTQFGWHIVEVLEHRNYDDTEEYKRNLAYRNIFQRKATVEEQLWIRRLRDQAYIDYRLEQ